jgi:hypothetical protein
MQSGFLRATAVAAMLASGVASACGYGGPREVASGPVTLGPEPTILIAPAPLAAAGPRIELTLGLPSGLGCDIIRREIRAADGRLITVRAALIASDGRRQELRGQGLVGLCRELLLEELVAVDPARNFRGVELTSDVPLEVAGVRWWSGEHRKLGI